LEQLTKAIILGIIQGFTEWLPISSTGHLKLAEHLLNFLSTEDSLFFEFTLHIGTLIVILVLFRKEIKNILSALVHLDFKSEYGKLIPLIIVGTIPAGIIGIALKELIEENFQSFLPIAVAFIFCGLTLFVSKAGKEQTDNISYSRAIVIGLAEGIAIIPGLSRSGLTIAIALLLGIRREKAFKFSFLLSIPAIIGAISYLFYSHIDTLMVSEFSGIDILAGVVAAMIVGFLALKLLWKIVANKQLHFFAFYCWLLGALLIIFSLSGF